MSSTTRRRLVVVAAAGIFLLACNSSPPAVPWDTARMTRELTADLRRFEGFTSEFELVEVLAWRVDSRVDSREDNARVEVALVWGRLPEKDGQARWTLIQGFRHPAGANTWYRSLVIRELKAPLMQPRPGEESDGTWHGFQRYRHAPTTAEICEFAAVDFFARGDDRGGYRRVAGDIRKQAWLRVAGEEPRCGFEP